MSEEYMPVGKCNIGPGPLTFSFNPGSPSTPMVSRNSSGGYSGPWYEEIKQQVEKPLLETLASMQQTNAALIKRLEKVLAEPSEVEIYASAEALLGTRTPYHNAKAAITEFLKGRRGV